MNLLDAEYVEPECENCGMLNVPLTRYHCSGCICLHCGKTAFEAGGSMNDMNWCDACEKELQSDSEPM
jgi:hypothetical protein